MNVQQTIQVHLEEAELQSLADGEPLQIPVKDGTGIVLYPPQNTEAHDE